ncbi:MAG TPA: XdhC family protein [Candidatus Angelobacter sp.]|jgi:xanthine dehydrogenase accessory factor|nr:XdhC family protein [Candidatus Angelobacter sp.]
MFDDFLRKSAELVEAGERFATATVVRCQPPTSGKLGDKAIVHEDGRLWGWIGGGCAQPVVIKEALKSLAEGRPRLVRISPSANGAEEGVVDYTMTCYSGGSLDIYIEPVLPRPHIVILGRSPVAQTLARLGGAIGYSVSVVAEEFMGEDFGDAAVSAQKDFSLGGIRFTLQTFVVVSTQGEGDEEALQQALTSEAAYVAFVASKTKAGKVMDFLRAGGLPENQLGRLRAPAGLNIDAKTPEEIAVSVLAEIIQVRGEKSSPASQVEAAELLPLVRNEARDPICGMMVDTGKSKYKSEYQGTWFYFCCTACKQKFEADPAMHAARD